MRTCVVTLKFCLPLGAKKEHCARVLEGSYQPLLELIDRYPQIRIALYFSGPLLDSLPLVRREGFVEYALQLRQRDQVEILCGPYYEPDFSLIGIEDAAVHLQLSKDYWISKGATQPRGVILPLAAYQPKILDFAAEMGFSYVVVEGLGDPPFLDDGNGTWFEFLTTSEEKLAVFLSRGRLFHSRQTDKDRNERGAEELVSELFPERVEREQQDDTFCYVDQVMTFSSAGDLARKTVDIEFYEQFFQLLAARANLVTVTYEQRIEQEREQRSAVRENPSGLEREGERVRARSLKPEQKLLSFRMRDLTRQIRLVESKSAEGYVLTERTRETLERANRCLAAGQYGLGEECGLVRGTQSSFFRGAVYQAFIRGQVEIDTLRHPDVDPMNGWVEHESVEWIEREREIFVVDTQLMRLYFRPELGGALVEFDYKPRKANLCSTVGSCLREALVGGRAADEIACFDADPRHSKLFEEPQITRQNSGLLCVRFQRGLVFSGDGEDAPYSAKLVKDVSCNAGIGAHRSDSTTGFSVEFWLEADNTPPPGLMLAQQWDILLPSRVAEGTVGFPLMCVGGVCQDSYDLSSTHLLTASEIPGGVYGIRLVDGLEDFSIDLRSAKQISSLSVRPIHSEEQADAEGYYHGINLRFLFDASQIYGGDKPNTIFLSIF